MLRLTTLGAIDLRDRLGQPIRDVLSQPKRVALLVYLAVEGRRGPVSRDRLLGLFWPESDEAKARNALSQALYHLRQALGQDVIESQGTNALAIRADALWCDATAFTDALDRGEVELALDLFRGDFCPTLFLSGTPDVEQWLDGQRRRLRVQALTAARAMAEGLVAGGDPAAGIRAARRALALEPDAEADMRGLITLLDRAGDATGALLAYQEYARRLAATLETEPAPETQRLAETIRRRREPMPPSPDHATTGSDAPASHLGSPIPPPPAERKLTWRPIVVGAILLGLLVIAGAVALRGRNQLATTRPARTIAVLPFTVREGSRLGYLRDGMVDLLSAKLGNAWDFHPIDPRAVIAAVKGHDSSGAPGIDPRERIARQLGAGWYIDGDLTEVAGRLQLHGALHALSPEPRVVATANVVGDTAALFELVDDLAGRMLAGLSGGRDTTLTRLAAVTTHSLPALKAFLAGEQALRAGRDAEAGAFFRSAASLDSGFALAQYRLALTATWVQVPGAEDPVAWANKAAQHTDRLTPLGQDLLAAYSAYKQVRAAEAERRYRELTEAFPDNVDAWMMLGETRFHYNPARGRSAMEAWPVFERVLALDPGNLHVLLHLARLAATDGRVATLDSLEKRYLGIATDATRGLEMRALGVYLRDDPRERAAISREAQQADDYVVTSLLQAAVLFAGNIPAARDLAPTFTDPTAAPLVRGVGIRILTSLDLAGGQWSRAGLSRWLGAEVDADWLVETEALLAAEPLLAIPRARVAAIRDSVAARRTYPSLRHTMFFNGNLGDLMQTYLLGLLDVRLGDTVAAGRSAVALLAERDTTRAMTASQLGHALRAEIARTHGDPKGALAALESFKFDLSPPWGRNFAHWGVRERFLRAELLLALGRDEEALPWYDSFQGPYDPPFLALAYLRRAQIHERLGHRERAAFHYGRFLAIWRDADPEFQPMVARARAALTELEAQAR